MSETAADILERFRVGFGKDIDLTLRSAYRDLLEKLGNPHLKLRNVIHVAGTNGKGSTCAFLRAALEAAGYSVHVYTSPHLVSIHERIRVKGRMIAEDRLYALLKECEDLSEPGTVSFFEASTAAALKAFAEDPADVTILEVGMGGRLDATNVIDTPAATVITRLSYDHSEFLGTTMKAIAGEKAGIMKRGVPCFSAAQPSEEALAALEARAKELDVPLYVGGRDWSIKLNPEPTFDDAFRFKSAKGEIHLPAPALLGAHQYGNAGLALATLESLSLPVPEEALRRAMSEVEWPARLQKIEKGELRALLPADWELWLDGGHNDSAGEALGVQLKSWAEGPSAKPLSLLYGMLATKDAQAFLRPLAPFAENAVIVEIEGDPHAQKADVLVADAKEAGLADAEAKESFAEALRTLAERPGPRRVLICGSLYLAGHFLAHNKACAPR